MIIGYFIGCASLFGNDIPPEIQMTAPSKWYSDIELQLEGSVTDNHDLPGDLLISWNSDIDGALDFASQKLSRNAYALVTTSYNPKP